MMRGYPLKFTPDEDGSVFVTCPSLPEVTTFGDDDSMARVHAVDAVEEAIAARMADWQDIPPPLERTRKDRAFAALPLQTIMKVELFRVVRQSGITRAELQRRLGWHREQVDRLFRLDHASRLDQMEAAFVAAGADIDLNVRMRKSA